MDHVAVPESEVVPLEQISSGVTGLAVVFTNVFAVAAGNSWVLVDAALHGSAARILKWAASQFGDTPPAAIVLTHGHFDHVGALKTLLDTWPNVAVYAHAQELPYVTGARSYPAPDPTVGGGAMARMAMLYPRKPIDVTGRVNPLPVTGEVPSLPGWRWIHTPGHTAGHLSLFRDDDRTLIVGDAFCTTKPESLFAQMATQRAELHGPPAYFTTDWDAARESVRKLSALQPEFVAPGHGRPMAGDATRAALSELAARFDQVARPEHGRYVDSPMRG